MKTGMYLMEVGEGNGQNIIVIERREQIADLCVDLDKNKEMAKLCHSLVVIPAQLFSPRLHQTNINRALLRLIMRRRHYDCKFIFVGEPDDALDYRIARAITDENIIG